MKHAREYKNTPRTIKLDSNLDQILKKVIDEKKSRILTTEDNKVTGLVTEKDLGFFLLTDETERKLEDILVSEIVIKPITVDESTELHQCAEMMLKNQIGSLVTTENDEVSGILTKTDLVRYYTKEHQGQKIVGEYMSPYYAW